MPYGGGPGSDPAIYDIGTPAEELAELKRTTLAGRLDKLATHLEGLDSESGDAKLLREAMRLVERADFWKRAAETNLDIAAEHRDERDELRDLFKGPHKTMTSEEYAAMPIVGWHMVCRDYDGFGGTGVRFITDGGCRTCGGSRRVKVARPFVVKAFEEPCPYCVKSTDGPSPGGKT